MYISCMFNRYIYIYIYIYMYISLLNFIYLLFYAIYVSLVIVQVYLFRVHFNCYCKHSTYCLPHISSLLVFNYVTLLLSMCIILDISRIYTYIIYLSRILYIYILPFAFLFLLYISLPIQHLYIYIFVFNYVPSFFFYIFDQLAKMLIIILYHIYLLFICLSIRYLVSIF